MNDLPQVRVPIKPRSKPPKPLLPTEQRVADAVAGMRAAEKRQYRISYGMCPLCGLEAAPYYLCFACRQIKSLSRTLNRMHDAGIVAKSRKGRNSLWHVEKDKIDDVAVMDVRGSLLVGIKDGDKRLRPRMGGRPIDLDETLMSIFAVAGKPLTEDEVYFAWGNLRTTRKRASLASDMAAIINAQRKRDRRAAKSKTAAQ